MADLVVPQLGESITEGVIARWLVQVGEPVDVDQNVVELETDKITVQLPAPAAGTVEEQRAAVGATVKVGQVIGTIKPGPGRAAAKPAEKPAPAGEAKKAPPAPTAKPAPAPGLQAAVVTSAAKPPPPGGNGQPGMDKDALLRLTPSQRQHAREAGKLPSREAGAPATGPGVEERIAKVDPRDDIVPMSPLRKRVAERLVQAQHESASLTTFNEVDMTAVMATRAKYKDQFEKAHGAKLGFMSFFAKACAAACRLYPGLNAEVIGGNIVYKKHYDFGIAVSAPKGLVVPVLRDVDKLSFAGVEKGIIALAEKAKNGTLGLGDLTGGTFSITNGGIFGSMMSTPLLNYPQTGILGMHNIVKRAVVIASPGSAGARSTPGGSAESIDDRVEIRPMMYVALSYDHRVVDGREAVSFLVAVKDRLEAPERLLIEA